MVNGGGCKSPNVHLPRAFAGVLTLGTQEGRNVRKHAPAQVAFPARDGELTMLNVEQNGTVDNVVATETLDGATVGSPPEVPCTLSGATDAEQKKIDEYRASEARVVDLAEATLDPKDMLKKYAKLGGEALKLAQRR